MAGIINEILQLPNTTAAGHGEITLNGNRFVSNYGTGNTFVGESSGNLTLTVGSARYNTSCGNTTLSALTTGEANTGLGYQALMDCTTGQSNTAVGWECMHNLVDGIGNSACGLHCLENSNGDYNVASGYNSGQALLTGSYNTLLGYTAGLSYVGAESSNILLRNSGTAAENNTIRIGVQGAGNGQQNRNFQAGIYNTTPSIVAATAIPLIDSAGQLGSLGLATNGQIPIGSTGATPVLATITAGANITVTNAAGAITIAAVGMADYAYTNVSTTPYVVTTEEYMSVDTSGAAITIKLPDAATSGHAYIIKDRSGNAAASNITVTTVTGAVLIDGAATFILNTAYQSISIIGSGTAYEVF